MLDIQFIRDNQKQVQEAITHKNADVDIKKLLTLDDQRRKLIQQTEELKAEKNKASKDIGRGADKQKIIAQMKGVGEKQAQIKKKLDPIQEEFEMLLNKIPNIVSKDTPKGKDESENKVIRKWGKPASFKFDVKDHVDLGKQLDIIDMETAAKVSGARFYYLKGAGAFLEFAIIQLVLNTLTNEGELKKIAKASKLDVSTKPFIPVLPPVMIKPDVFKRMARLSEEDKDEKFYTEKDDLYLIGSAEHTLGPLHMDSIIDEQEFPIRYIGFSTSFRREAGSYGKDTRGILRVHQFDKLEAESFTLPENGLAEQNFIVAIQEYLLQSLELPYQVVQICTGDMGGPDYRQIDIETWIPSQKKYRETHTSDYMADYQSRRLNIKAKRSDGKKELVHMNDATAFAISRILIAIIENNQNQDGSITIPRILRPYMGNIDNISL